MEDLLEDHRTDYIGEAYEITAQVAAFHGVTRFGRSSDFTDLLSADQNAQASYAAGLLTLSVFSISFFVFWSLGLITFKCMSSSDAGFLSGSPFKAEPKDKSRCINGQTMARILFLVATCILWLSAVLLLVKGVAELDGTANAADDTLVTLRNKIEAAEDITKSVQELGIKSVKIRDKIVYLFDAVICDAVDIESTLGVSFSDLKSRARDDLNKLSDFLYNSLVALISGINTANNLTGSAEKVVSEIRLGGWPAILVSGLLFILPAFFVVGVSCAFKNVRAKRFQQYLSYIILPMFICVIGFCIVVCCILIPLATMNADFCTGSNSGGPDDTILTSYRNLLGNDRSIKFYVVAYYTQRCFAEYYPYDFLGSYYDKLISAQTSIEQLITALGGNLYLTQLLCGSDDGELFLSLAQSMKSSLDLIKETVDSTLSLVNCEEINKMYSDAVHSAACTHAPTAMGWIYGSLLTISICGMVMITLRSSYLTPERGTNVASINEAMAAKQRAQESESRLQQLYRNRQSKHLTPQSTSAIECIPEEEPSSAAHQYELPSAYRYQDHPPLSGMNNDVPHSWPPYLSHRDEDGFVVITPEEQDDVSTLY